MLREYRGDAHTSAWTAAGFDATEIGLLTELYWGLPMRTYIRTRAWSDADLDAAEDRLVDRGLVADGAFTDEGRSEREAVERATDRQCRPIVDALGDDVDELLAILLPWAQAVRDAHGYPASAPTTWPGRLPRVARTAAGSVLPVPLFRRRRSVRPEPAGEGPGSGTLGLACAAVFATVRPWPPV